jgi:LysR family nod box-dependent transcriptional activator
MAGNRGGCGKAALQVPIEVVCVAFSQVPWIVAGSTRLALMLARELAPGLGLLIQEPLFLLPVMREMMQFHSTRKMDRGLAWLCEQLQAVAGAGEKTLRTVET